MNLLNYGLAFFESTDDAFRGKMYRMATRNTGSGFPLLFSHLQVMFKIHNEILSRIEKGSVSSSSTPRSNVNISNQFELQLCNANKKLEEFILMLLDSFNLSESTKLVKPIQSHPSCIVIRLLVEIINSLTIIKNAELKRLVIDSCVRYFYSLKLVEREGFVQRIALQFEKLSADKDLVEESVAVII